MKFVSQLDYPHIPHLTETLKEQPNLESTVKSSGCGLCSACMIVDLLTDQEFNVFACLCADFARSNKGRQDQVSYVFQKNRLMQEGF